MSSRCSIGHRMVSALGPKRCLTATYTPSMSVTRGAFRLGPILGVVGVIVLSACSASAPDASALLDKTFTTSSITTAGATEPLVLDSTLSITFTADGVSAKADCNTLFGPATLDDGVISMTGQVASTMMACDPALMDQDQRIIDFLSATPSWSLDETTLTLTTDDASMTLTQSTQ